jgi:hypothetical protein
MSLSVQQESSAALTYEARGYLMIEKLRVENFRCFKSANIKGLKRVNIIVGENASGKTVLLESIKLGLDGLPGSLPFLNQVRNMPMVFPQNPTPEQFQSPFLDLFHLFESQGEILIAIEDSQHRTSELRIHFDPSKATTIQPQMGFQAPQMVPIAPPTTIIPLAFDRSDFQGRKDTILVTLDPQGKLFFQPGKPLGIVSGLISIIYFGGLENAQILSGLDIEKRSKEVKEAIRRHFPFISDVTSETPAPGMGVVYADLPSLPQRKIPLSLVSGGISRLFTMILCIVQYKGGAVLIDEIENGLYFEQYPMVWKTLGDLAKYYDTQLFITTHSLECLRGSLDTIKANEEDFLLLRIEKEDGSSKITPIEAKFIEAAIEQGFDVR